MIYLVMAHVCTCMYVRFLCICLFDSVPCSVHMPICSRMAQVDATGFMQLQDLGRNPLRTASLQNVSSKTPTSGRKDRRGRIIERKWLLRLDLDVPDTAQENKSAC